MALPTANSYIEPVSYEELVAANSDARIDPRSTEVLEREKTYIEKWRRVADVGRSTDEVEKTLAGLALSGGGIRSATFALGVTQAFAAQDLMRRFDYLSTVSGGGYLGSSLTWLTRHANTKAGGDRFTFGMEPKRFPYPIDPPDRQTDRRSQHAQDAQLIYLRQHGRYLTPGRGIDLVSAIAVVLRGVMLNLLVWLPITAFVLLVIRSGPSADTVLSLVGLKGRFPGGYGWLALITALAALFFAALGVSYSLITYRRVRDNPRWYTFRRKFEWFVRYVLWAIVATLPVALLSLVTGAVRDWLTSLGLASIVTGIVSAVGVFLGSRSGSNKHGLSMSIVAPLGAVLLLYGFLILGYVWAEHVYALWHREPMSPSLFASLGLLVIAGATGYLVNVNLISVHRYYRDRLMEAFLPDPPKDGGGARITYTDLAADADVGKLHHFGEARLPTDPYIPTGPYHLVNTNVILVDSQERNRRVRGGDSFVLSPLLCGSSATGWCRTSDFLGGDLSLATAMAISGAAANPYAGGGLFRNRPVAVLMSLVNLRLGYWVGHPNPAKRRVKGRSHFNTAWRELSGKLSEDRPMLQLSDGGHFDNLGIYELIRRRARLIVACDGTADPDFAFSDFITLLARIEADFGARIVFDEATGLELFMPSDAAGFPRNTQLAKQGFTVGRIRYSDDSKGDLIYITTTLFKGLGLAALGYKAGNPDFPDQTTADQFFDDAQFEAYRILGYSVGEAVLTDDNCRDILTERVGFVPSAS
jgi:Patatin-like phospholipase